MELASFNPNQQLLKKLIVVALVMFAFGYALVPLYEKLCEVTGINNIGQADAKPVNTQIDTSRLITIEFDSNLRDDLPWEFRPAKKSITAHPGELVNIEYAVKNRSSRVILGQAIPSYSPQQSALYFKKLDCFCFKQQRFKANEERIMPVVFVVDAELPKDINTITLSYTFFKVEGV